MHDDIIVLIPTIWLLALPVEVSAAASDQPGIRSGRRVSYWLHLTSPDLGQHVRGKEIK